MKPISIGRILLLLFFIGSVNSLICSYDDEKTSEDLMRLTSFQVGGSNPVILGDSIEVVFTIKNVDKLDKQFGDYGLFLKAETPSGKKRALAYDYSNDIIKSLEELKFSKEVKFNEVGKWIIWPSYNIIVNNEDKYGPDYWETCEVYVERECEDSECLTEDQAEKEFENPVKADEEVCGYEYLPGYPEEEKYCYAEFSDEDNDTIADVLDRCKDEPETFNSFRDDDGCPDVLPRECPSGTYCFAYVDENEYVPYTDENGSFIVCGYAGITIPKICYKKKSSLPDLYIMSVTFDPLNPWINVSVGNNGGDVNRTFRVSYIIKNSTGFVLKSDNFRMSPILSGNSDSERILFSCQEDFDISISVDSFSQVEESNEDNNKETFHFECNKKPDYIITNFSLKDLGDNLFEISYTLENKGFAALEKTITSLSINNEFFADSEANPVPEFTSLVQKVSRIWKASCPLNVFEFTADSTNLIDESNESNNVAIFPVVVNLTCPSSCHCVEGPVESLESKGYVPCFECNGEPFVCRTTSSQTLVANIQRVFYCMATKIFNDFPCPPSQEHFGYYEEHYYPAVFSHWDDMEVGNVWGDEMDEILIARDDNGGVLNVYKGDGTLLNSFPIRYTKYDRLTLADLDGDGYKEIVTAVDDDASGKKGRFYVYKLTGNSLNLVKTFDETFEHYDEVLGGDLLNLGKDQLIVVSEGDEKLYVYVMGKDPSGNTVIFPEKAYDFAIDGYEFRYTDKAKDHVDDEIKIGNFLSTPGDEIALFKNNNDFEKSYVEFFTVDKNTDKLKLLRTIKFPFTKYDAVGVGDILGDDFDEFFVGIDEHRAVYIGDALHGLLKIHFRKYTKYDDIEAGNIVSVGKQQLLIAIDEDDKIYYTFEEDLMEG